LINILILKKVKKCDSSGLAPNALFLFLVLFFFACHGGALAPPLVINKHTP